MWVWRTDGVQTAFVDRGEVGTRPGTFARVNQILGGSPLHVGYLTNVRLRRIQSHRQFSFAICRSPIALPSADAPRMLIRMYSHATKAPTAVGSAQAQLHVLLSKGRMLSSLRSTSGFS